MQTTASSIVSISERCAQIPRPTIVPQWALILSDVLVTYSISPTVLSPSSLWLVHIFRGSANLPYDVDVEINDISASLSLHLLFYRFSVCGKLSSTFQIKGRCLPRVPQLESGQAQSLWIRECVLPVPRLPVTCALALEPIELPPTSEASGSQLAQPRGSRPVYAGFSGLQFKRFTRCHHGRG